MARLSDQPSLIDNLIPSAIDAFHVVDNYLFFSACDNPTQQNERLSSRLFEHL